MSIAAGMLDEFDHEMALTRTVVEHVPNDKLDFKPWDSAWTMGELMTHLVNVPQWATTTIETEVLDFAKIPPREALSSVDIALSEYDQTVKRARDLIAKASDDHLLADWTAEAGGHHVMTLPRAAVLRSFVMNHMIHHRAQLGVYLRLAGARVPAVYGPTADER